MLKLKNKKNTLFKMLEAKFNSVDYDIPTNLSVVNERTFKTVPPIDQRPFGSDHKTGKVYAETNFRLTIGNYEFVDMWTSWLTFDVSPEANCYQSQYLSSLSDFISDITIMDRNNVELERITNLHLLNSMIVVEKYGRAYTDSVGHSLGYGSYYKTAYPGDEDLTVVPATAGPPEQAADIPYRNIYPGTLRDVWWTDRNTANPDDERPAETYRVSIPMALLAGLFSTDKLLPPHLMSGMIINLRWADAQDVLYPNITSGADGYHSATAAAPPAGATSTQNFYPGISPNPTLWPVPRYAIKNLAMVLDCFTLDRAIVDQMTEAFNGAVGIPIAFQTYTQVTNEIISIRQTNVTLPISQSFSNATKVIGTIRMRCSGVATTADPLNFVNSTAMIPWLYGQPPVDFRYQLRYNGISYPDKPVENVDMAYNLWLAAFGKTRLYDSVIGISSNDFKTKIGSTFVVDLSRAGYNFRISGSAVNTQANFMRSGQRMDGTNPATIWLSLGDALFAAKTFEPLDMDSPTIYRLVSSWVEHERILLCQSTGNRLLI